MLTAERLRELLGYDPETGIFTRRKAPRRGLEAGTIAGSPDADGYLNIMIDGRQYKTHRLAWLWVYGEWPPDQIDHKDTIKHHNWIENLRPATNSQNNANKPRSSARNKSGFKGVCFHRASQRWRAQIKNGGTNRHLGYFDTPELAAAAYIVAAQQLFGQFARSE